MALNPPGRGLLSSLIFLRSEKIKKKKKKEKKIKKYTEHPHKDTQNTLTKKYQQ